MKTTVTPIRWHGTLATGQLLMLDQRLLPADEVWLPMATAGEVADGIRDMVIRGAPAIGIAAAYGVALAVRERAGQGFDALADLEDVYAQLAATRPTAVNLFWALKRMRRVLEEAAGLEAEALVERAFAEAQAICEEDRQNNLRMGRLGADLLPDGARVLTHCNTGGLATGGYGTALGVIRAGFEAGKVEHVWVDETRPYLQGARLTAWECLQDGIPSTLITDSMAGHFMARGEVDAVIVGTDRVVANGDIANKIGTYALAVLCRHHDIPFYVAAPVSTIDLETPSGDAIDIEQRSAAEVTHIGQRAIAPEGIQVAHPAFDVTPHALIDAIITERGVVTPPFVEGLRRLVEDGHDG